MKKIVVVLVLLTTTLSFAQERQRGERPRQNYFEDLSAEQIATLHTKKMALALDLTNDQVKKVQKINLENAEQRKAHIAERKANRENADAKRPTAEERYEFENARLDRQLAVQKQMQDILSDEQYQKWKKMSHRKHKKGNKRPNRDDAKRG